VTRGRGYSGGLPSAEELGPGKVWDGRGRLVRRILRLPQGESAPKPGHSFYSRRKVKDLRLSPDCRAWTTPSTNKFRPVRLAMAIS
jgi:hypothetical protein